MKSYDSRTKLRDLRRDLARHPTVKRTELSASAQGLRSSYEAKNGDDGVEWTRQIAVQESKQTQNALAQSRGAWIAQRGGDGIPTRTAYGVNASLTNAPSALPGEGSGGRSGERKEKGKRFLECT